MKTKFSAAAALTAVLLALSSCAGTSPAGGGAKRYPLTTCLVTDNALGSMGEVVTRVHAGQEVKFCCKPCVKKFEAAPESYLNKLPR